MHTSSPSELHPETKPKILVVDDQPMNIQFLYEMLKDEFEVFMATNGADALETCRSTPPDLVLMDVVMPKQDGFETCSMIKLDSTTQHIPVFFVTGCASTEERARGAEVGADEFILKPVAPGYLKARIHAELRGMRR